jgi:hypothetical protein
MGTFRFKRRREEEEEEGNKQVSKHNVSLFLPADYLTRACSAIVIVRSNDSVIDHCGSQWRGVGVPM